MDKENLNMNSVAAKTDKLNGKDVIHKMVMDLGSMEEGEIIQDSVDEGNLGARIIKEVEEIQMGVWRILTVYGSKEVLGRRELCRDIELYSSKDTPSIMGGDFNCLLAKEDKKGGKRFLFSQGLKEMIKFLSKNDLQEAIFLGPRFTWCNNKVGGECILERLDRCYLNSMAIGFSQLMVVQYLTRIASDNCPILLNLIFESFIYWSKAKLKDLNELKECLKKDIYELRMEEANVEALF
ncbi:uncharacterized protein LOC114579910 [Dendrobium catenatum]|uniref:uncharacterized protein LOC114579910 n=1 Tax=Dendrobium catenatum TaxID=906689 RepID=UPI00109FA5AF|nr:uncharacterized protein LOC114579910 [Dendrobium catenatum]